MKKKVIPANEWLDRVRYGGMADHEGFAYAIIDGTVNTYHMMVPSRRGGDLPEGVTEVELNLGL